MLRLGTRQYELVRAQSGFAVCLCQHARLERTQEWRLRTHYVPTEATPEPRDDGEFEYWAITIWSQQYYVRHWRNLSGLGLDDDERDWFGSCWMENLLASGRREECHTIVPGTLEVTHVRDYLFHCEFDGVVKRGSKEEELEFEDDIPFAEVSMGVAINAPDPVATARALAVRSHGADGIRGGRPPVAPRLAAGKGRRRAVGKPPFRGADHPVVRATGLTQTPDHTEIVALPFGWRSSAHFSTMPAP